MTGGAGRLRFRLSVPDVRPEIHKTAGHRPFVQGSEGGVSLRTTFIIIIFLGEDVLAMAAERPLLSFIDVTKEYATGKGTLQALGGVTFDVFPHEFVSIVGPSGCGKTTLLKIVANLLEASSGEIIVDKSVFDPEREAGFVFQKPLLLEWRRVIDNVMLPAEILGLDRKMMRRRAVELLELVGLAGFENSYPRELSGGMQQRVAIARALIHDPKLLLMDEPFGALDAITREQMNLELMRISAEAQKTVLFVTHSIGEAVFISDRVIVLSARPSRMLKALDINLPRPRTVEVRSDAVYGQHVVDIYNSLGIN